MPWIKYRTSHSALHAVYVFTKEGETRHGLTVHGVHALRVNATGGNFMRRHGTQRRWSRDEVREMHRYAAFLRRCGSTEVYGVHGRRPWKLESKQAITGFVYPSKEPTCITRRYARAASKS
jgi:hypothetical protein